MKLAEFQAKLRQPERLTEGHGYNYANLPSVLAAIRSVGGVGVSQRIEGARTLITTITGIDEITTSSTFEIPDSFFEARTIRGAQLFGSAITYARRYTLCAMLGIVGVDEDDDCGDPEPQKPEQRMDAPERLLQRLQKPTPKPEPKTTPKVSRSELMSQLLDMQAGDCGQIVDVLADSGPMTPSDIDDIVSQTATIMGDAGLPVVKRLLAKHQLTPYSIDSLQSALVTNATSRHYVGSRMIMTVGVANDIETLQALRETAIRCGFTARLLTEIDNKLAKLQ